MATSTFGDNNQYTYNVDAKGIPYGDPLASNVISSSSLAPVHPIPLASNAVPPVSTALVNADLQAGQDSAQAKVDALNKQGQQDTSAIASLQSLLGEKSTDTNKTYKDTGVTDLYNQVTDLNAQAKALNLEAQAAPIQTQDNIRQTGNATTDAAAGVQTTDRLRINALKALSLGQQYAIASGNYDKAKNYADQIINAKYDQMQADINAKITNLNALDKYSLTPAEEKLKTAQLALLTKQTQDVAEKKATETAIQNIAIEAAKSGNATASQIADISKAKTFDEALKAAGNSLATSSNEFIKLDNGTTVLADKKTGKIIKYLGGSKDTPITTPTTPIIRTVTTPSGKKAPVDSYTLNKGDDPYFIAQKNGIDMQALKDLNLTVKDWNNLPVGAVLNIPSKTMGSGAITAVAGLPLVNFNYLTQGTSALTRLNQADRSRIMAESDAWLKSKGIDYSTFQSRYKAYNKVVEDNVARANNTTVYGGEVSGTVDQFVSDIGTDFGKLKALNLADLWAGKQLNDPIAQKYAFDLITMRNDLAGYYAASRGKGEADDADKRSAELVIQSGINAKSANAFKESINSNEQKVTGVVNKAVDTANKQVWDLFGVGDQYKPVGQKLDPLQNIQNYGNNHPEQQSVLTKMKLDGISVEDISNWVNQQH